MLAIDGAQFGVGGIEIRFQWRIVLWQANLKTSLKLNIELCRLSKKPKKRMRFRLKNNRVEKRLAETICVIQNNYFYYSFVAKIGLIHDSR